MAAVTPTTRNDPSLYFDYANGKQGCTHHTIRITGAEDSDAIAAATIGLGNTEIIDNAWEADSSTENCTVAETAGAFVFYVDGGGSSDGILHVWTRGRP